jgi:hypothetical protein
MKVLFAAVHESAVGTEETRKPCRLMSAALGRNGPHGLKCDLPPVSWTDLCWKIPV